MKTISFNITNYKATEIKTKTAFYKIGKTAIIIDEGNFYRIADSFIIDKYRIISTSLDGNHLSIHLKDEDNILTVEPK